MAEPLLVLMEGELAGALATKGAYHRFVYDDSYRATENATPISTSMSLAIARHDGELVTSWLWGLLPENELVIARWAREFRVSGRDPMAILSSPVGRDCAGAVQFVPHAELDDVLERGGHVTWLTEADIADLIGELQRDSTAWLGSPKRHGQFSLAGAQAKLGLRIEGDRWGLPSGSAATTHILKTGIEIAGDGSRLDEQALNEHICVAAARHAGLLAARSQVHTFGGAQVIVVERYDRIRRGEAVVRIHQEDTCQALAISPAAKYEADEGPSPQQIGRLLRDRIAPAAAASESVLRFLDALAFNWLIGGTDAHAKNYSLLLSGSDVRLAPLYDVASSFPYWHPKKLRLAMKLGGDDRVWPWVNHWPAVSAELGLDVDIVHERVSALCERVPGAFERAAASLDPEVASRSVVDRIVEGVAAQCRRCSTILQTSAWG